jgi:hypothetical protein
VISLVASDSVLIVPSVLRAKLIEVIGDYTRHVAKNIN